MEKTIFEQMGGTYEQQGDYLIPYLTLPSEEENQSVSLWGQRHSHYLKQNHRMGIHYIFVAVGKVFGIHTV